MCSVTPSTLKLKRSTGDFVPDHLHFLFTLFPLPFPFSQVNPKLHPFTSSSALPSTNNVHKTYTHTHWSVQMKGSVLMTRYPVHLILQRLRFCSRGRGKGVHNAHAAPPVSTPISQSLRWTRTSLHSQNLCVCPPPSNRPPHKNKELHDGEPSANTVITSHLCM